MVFSGGESLDLKKKNYQQIARGFKKRERKKKEVALDNFVACLFRLTRSTMACEEEPGKPTSMVSQKKSRKQKRGWKITATLDVLLSVVVFFFSFSTCALSLSPNTFSSKYTIHKIYIYILDT